MYIGTAIPLAMEVAEIALYHALGRLPEPNLTHEFC